jgi:hypothetical protein
MTRVPTTPAWDCIVTGSETEACLAAVAAARVGSRTLLIVESRDRLGGILTWGGLAYVDRDSRHVVPPVVGGGDGLFGEFLARADVALVALDPHRGRSVLEEMLDESGVTVIVGRPARVSVEGGRLRSLTLDTGEMFEARFAIDGSADGDLLELLGGKFETGFRAHGLDRVLGTSPMPRLHGVTPSMIVETCRRLADDPDLEALRRDQFGDRPFLGLEQGEDWILVGPPHLGLAYRRFREANPIPGSDPLEADGFNIAVLGPELTSWNGLLLDIREPGRLLRLSREGADDLVDAEGHCFERFLRDELGWTRARVVMPRGLYVRQTRHLVQATRRLTFADILSGAREDAVGTFSYYPDFRGLHLVPVHRPLLSPVPLGAGIFAPVPNVGIAGRAAGYTPFAHSLARLVQFGCILGSALGVATSLAHESFEEAMPEHVRAGMARIGAGADDPAGAAGNRQALETCQGDPFLALELA